MTLEEPTTWELMRNFAGAVARWAEAGFAVTTRDQFYLRKVTCDSCSEWTGRTCRRCGCTRLKLWLATERCPAGRWLQTV